VHGLDPERHRHTATGSVAHTMWFHRLGRADDWLLRDQRIPATSGGLGHAEGRIFSRSGVLLASVAQVGLLRPPRDWRLSSAMPYASATLSGVRCAIVTTPSRTSRIASSRSASPIAIRAPLSRSRKSSYLAVPCGLTGTTRARERHGHRDLERKE
jgi:Thioesterase-like superfamily